MYIFYNCDLIITEIILSVLSERWYENMVLGR